MWRPNDWKNPHNPEATIFASEEAWFSVRREHKAYEAGADAMLSYLVGKDYLEDAFIMDEDPEEEDDGDN